MYQTFRRSSLPYLLMTPEQRSMSRQLEYNGRHTSNFDCCDDTKKSFQKILSNTRNVPLVHETIGIMDSVLGVIKAAQNGVTPLQYKQILFNIKTVHDNLQKIGSLQEYEKVLEKHLDTVSTLYRKWIENNQPTTVKQQDPDDFHNEPTKVLNPTNEGADFHLSRAYYDRRAKKWIQRRVKQVDTELEKEQDKEERQIQREDTEPKIRVTYDKYVSNQEVPLYTKSMIIRTADEKEAIDTVKKLVGGRNHRAEVVKEDRFSFKDFIIESELNTTARLQADGDVTSKGEDSVYIDKSKKKEKPKFKVSVNTQSDPLSS